MQMLMCTSCIIYVIINSQEQSAVIDLGDVNEPDDGSDYETDGLFFFALSLILFCWLLKIFRISY